MDTINPVDLELRNRLKDRSFRFRFFISRSRHEIASQIRSLRLLREMRQIDVAREGGLGESAVSRIEQPDYSGWTFKTLWKVARALDARVRITFEPMESVIQEYEKTESELISDVIGSSAAEAASRYQNQIALQQPGGVRGSHAIARYGDSLDGQFQNLPSATIAGKYTDL